MSVEAGSYSLYSLPGESIWRIVVNADARWWGIPIDEEIRGRDVGSGTVPADTLGKTVERLTLRLLRRSHDRGVLRIEWERTGLSVPIGVRPDPGERETHAGIRRGGQTR